MFVFAGISARADDRVIASGPSGECTLRVEASGNSPTLRLRAGHPQMRPCAVEQPAMLAVLEQAFTQVGAGSAVFTSLALGRLIDYPWMVRALSVAAAQDRMWDAASGRARRGLDVNRYVAGILERPDIAGAIEAPLRRHGYRIAGVSVEKVLVGGFENVPGWDGPRVKGKIPFDAQVWLRLEVDP